MNASDGLRDTYRQTQKGAHLHALAEQPIKRLAAGVVEHQNGATLVPRQRQRPHGPSRIELGRQRIFVLDARQCCRRSIFAGGRHDEHTRKNVGRARVNTPVQDEVAILVERLELVSRKIHHDAPTDVIASMAFVTRLITTPKGILSWMFAAIGCSSEPSVDSDSAPIPPGAPGGGGSVS